MAAPKPPPRWPQSLKPSRGARPARCLSCPPARPVGRWVGGRRPHDNREGCRPPPASPGRSQHWSQRVPRRPPDSVTPERMTVRTLRILAPSVRNHPPFPGGLKACVRVTLRTRDSCEAREHAGPRRRAALGQARRAPNAAIHERICLLAVSCRVLLGPALTQLQCHAPTHTRTLPSAAGGADLANVVNEAALLAVSERSTWLRTIALLLRDNPTPAEVYAVGCGIAAAT